MGEGSQKLIQTSSYKISPEAVMYSIVNIIINTIAYLKVDTRIDLRSPHYKKFFFELCKVTLIGLNVVIILQYIQIWNHVLYLML